MRFEQAIVAVARFFAVAEVRSNVVVAAFIARCLPLWRHLMKHDDPSQAGYSIQPMLIPVTCTQTRRRLRRSIG